MTSIDDLFRRKVLVNTIGLGTFLLAGCTGNTNNNPATTQPTETPTAPSPVTTSEGPNPEVTEAITNAGDIFTTAAEKFQTEVEKLDQSFEFVEFQTEEIFDLLDSASEELDHAGSLATTTKERDAIGTFDSLGDWLRTITESLESYGTALSDLERAESYFFNDRYSDSADELETVLQSLDTSATRLDQAETVYDEIDVSTVAFIPNIIPDEVSTGMETVNEDVAVLRTYVESMTYYSDGVQHFSIGMEPYQTGKDVVGEGQYENAIEPFESARDEFESAYESSVAGEEIAPQELFDRFLTLTCVTENYRDAADQFHITFIELQAGNEDIAGEAYSRAIDAEEAANNCLNDDA